MTWLWQKTSTPNDAVNLACTGCALAVYYFKEAMKQAGWVVMMSGDASTYWPASDGITHGSSGAGGMDNTNAWFRIRSPAGAGGREYTFQRMAVATTWRMKYSPSAGFTQAPIGGGSIDATHTPSATDQAIVVGAGTDASPTGTISLTASASKLHIGTDNAAPYTFYMTQVVNGAVICSAWLVGDGLIPGLSPAADTDQWVTQWKYTVASFSNLQNCTTGGFLSYYKKGLSGEAFVSWGLAWDPTKASEVCPINPWTNNDESLPIPLMRQVSVGNGGYKGWMNSIRCRLTMSRAIPDYLDDAGPPATRWAYFDGLALPYPTTVTPTT